MADYDKVLGIMYNDEDITNEDIDAIQTMVDEETERIHRKLKRMGYVQVMGVLFKTETLVHKELDKRFFDGQTVDTEVLLEELRMIIRNDKNLFFSARYMDTPVFPLIWEAFITIVQGFMSYAYGEDMAEEPKIDSILRWFIGHNLNYYEVIDSLGLEISEWRA